jgi:hypothetical protein
MTGALVPTGIVTHCCDLHHAGPAGACCDELDCGPCCPECPTCPRVQATPPAQRRANASHPTEMHRVGKKAAGRLLGGLTYDEYPERAA